MAQAPDERQKICVRGEVVNSALNKMFAAILLLPLLLPPLLPMRSTDGFTVGKSAKKCQKHAALQKMIFCRMLRQALTVLTEEAV